MKLKKEQYARPLPLLLLTAQLFYHLVIILCFYQPSVLCTGVQVTKLRKRLFLDKGEDSYLLGVGRWTWTDLLT